MQIDGRRRPTPGWESRQIRRAGERQAESAERGPISGKRKPTSADSIPETCRHLSMPNTPGPSRHTASLNFADCGWSEPQLAVELPLRPQGLRLPSFRGRLHLHLPRWVPLGSPRGDAAEPNFGVDQRRRHTNPSHKRAWAFVREGTSGRSAPRPPPSDPGTICPTPMPTLDLPRAGHQTYPKAACSSLPSGRTQRYLTPCTAVPESRCGGAACGVNS